MKPLDALNIAGLDPKDAERIAAAAKVLGEYGLGVSFPHKHTKTGSIVALPEDEVSLEVDGKVSFVPRDAVPPGTRPVGWRVVDGKLACFAECCAGRDDGPNTVAPYSQPVGRTREVS
ncbi:hypothetical protein [Tahibacter caeni]|uniref:hypothetical protein n=1 Tax=Tahibacter caeni TaxID=1453545 RepID=UPI002148B4A0|nr:hypothetical protein [Tahibacter caeni]